MAQSPPANSTSVTSPNVSLLTAGPARPQAYVMPSFVGSPLAFATRALGEARIHVGSVAAAPDVPGDAAPLAPIGPASIILSQTPAPGQRVLEGQSVNFEVRP